MSAAAELTTLPCDRDSRWTIDWLGERVPFELLLDGDSSDHRKMPVYRRRFEHREVAHCVTVVFGFFLQHYLEAAAHDVFLVGIHISRLATTHPVELGRVEPVDHTAHRGHAGEPRREHLVA